MFLESAIKLGLAPASNYKITLFKILSSAHTHPTSCDSHGISKYLTWIKEHLQ